MVDIARSKFEPGRVLATPAALQMIASAGHSPLQFVNRHTSGDWGELSPEDYAHNDEALRSGSRIVSAYIIAGGQRIWIITEAADEFGHRPASTILLPEEY
ncbi:MAG: hypothetical protein ACYC3X_26205 [Pirellulaceae bacterium]